MEKTTKLVQQSVSGANAAQDGELTELELDLVSGGFTPVPIPKAMDDGFTPVPIPRTALTGLTPQLTSAIIKAPPPRF